MNMIEKCARALWSVSAETEHEDTWEELSEGWRDNFRMHAEAVLRTLREPTPQMVDRFVSRALCVSIHGEKGWSNYAVAQWQTMIDAALEAPRS